jgi:hypothetical protein
VITVSVKSNLDAVLRQFITRTPKEVERATNSAVNKVARGARTRMQRAITSEYRISAATVRERLFVQRASKKGLAFTAVLLGNNKAKGRGMNLIYFAQEKLTGKEKAVWRKQSATKRGGIRAPQIPLQIKRTGGRVYVKGAFVGNMGRTLFKRTGDSRLPIEALHTIGVPQMFNSTKNVRAVEQWVNENFPRILKAEMRYFVGNKAP